MIEVIDNFIKDTRILSDIEWDTSFWNRKGFYYYWKGTPANTLKKRIINYIWSRCPQQHDTIAYEYWTHKIYDKGIGVHKKKLPPHRDTDEQTYLRKHVTTLYPNYGCVYYPVENDIEGGNLVIHHTNGETMEIEPKKNRLVWFPSGELDHEIQPVTKGTRYSLAINTWNYENYTMSMGLANLE